MKVASVCVAGDPAQQTRSTRNRLNLLDQVVSRITSKRRWADLDAVLFPAGFLRSNDWFGPLNARKREQRLRSAEWGERCRKAACQLGIKSPGCSLVIGIDTGKPNRYWRGDQMMVAYDISGPTAWARKIFPVSGDTDQSWRCPILLFENDFVDEKRFFTLPSGGEAVLSACYDAFVYRELVKGPTNKRAAMRFMGVGREGWDVLPRWKADQWLGRHQTLLADARPVANLIGIHRFRRPGSEVLWQRHGISTACAALGGVLTIGAAHFFEELPSKPNRTPLASFNVGSEQLGPGPRRLVQEYPAQRQLIVRKTATGPPAAVVRLFTAP